MGAIHDAELPLKRVESVYRYRYIGIRDHRFRGQSLGCGRGGGRCLQQRPAPACSAPGWARTSDLILGGDRSIQLSYGSS
jgi:hypothetical protein